jgi:hypothetical protein
MVEIQGLKPWTSALPGQRSNQLSYIPLTATYCSKTDVLCQAPRFERVFTLFNQFNSRLSIPSRGYDKVQFMRTDWFGNTMLEPLAVWMATLNDCHAIL